MSDHLPSSRFDGRTAMVTGAAGGIGSAISARLAREGAHVVVCDVAPDGAEAVTAAIRETGGSAEALCFDLTDPAACTEAVESVVRQHGRLDVLVNNAGVNRRGALETLTEQDWDLSLAVNISALFHLCRAAAPPMRAAGGGAIVNTASQWGIHPAAGHLAYNVSKAAVVAFTKSMARDSARDGIRVNAVAPGEVRTPMVEAGLARAGRTVAELDALVPFGRIGEPDEIAALVAFLASDEAPFLCGSVVEITGAQSVA